MKAMILAAGLGNRMRPLTDHLPKPLICVAGKPLIEYHLEKLSDAGITEVIINVAYLGEKIIQHLGDGSRWNLQIRYSHEQEPLETGGAIAKALPLLGNEPFLLINADVWCDIDFSWFVGQSLPPAGGATLLLVDNPSFHQQGDFGLGANGQIILDVPQKFTFAGISVVDPALIADYPERREKFPLVEALRYAINKNTLNGQYFTGYWSDVGTPLRLSEVESHLRTVSTGQNKSH